MPEQEFDNPGDIERDEWAAKNPVVQAWKDLDDVALKATKYQLLDAVRYLNHSIKGDDRKAIYRILGGQ
jgi:hypothetical protein